MDPEFLVKEEVVFLLFYKKLTPHEYWDLLYNGGQVSRKKVDARGNKDELIDIEELIKLVYE